MSSSEYKLEYRFKLLFKTIFNFYFLHYLMHKIMCHISCSRHKLSKDKMSVGFMSLTCPEPVYHHSTKSKPLGLESLSNINFDTFFPDAIPTP